MILMRSMLAAAVGLLFTGSAMAAKAPPRTYSLTDGTLTVQVVDVSPRFLAFYQAAKSAPDADTRFKLWQDLYGFAAVPPTIEGQAMARRLVDSAPASPKPRCRNGSARCSTSCSPRPRRNET